MRLFITESITGLDKDSDWWSTEWGSWNRKWINTATIDVYCTIGKTRMFTLELAGKKEKQEQVSHVEVTDVKFPISSMPHIFSNLSLTPCLIQRLFLSCLVISKVIGRSDEGLLSWLRYEISGSFTEINESESTGT